MFLEKTLLFLVGIVIGNYIYQFFGSKDYDAAFERSYFQAAAIGMCLFMHYLNGNLK
ncbi:hypothetical protein [Leptospira johnsonii]|uniref:Uncharacterized protein n=1 Tax=Leptospira johnsonii TaxID=1917820 RepID=A0A2P2D7R7_9LEPT|nr:hypothetical protein [Leptospira johnsonii]GBF40676.1 hypothetical protein LPTSP1_36940 [Leptospira johnsonii]